MSRAKGHIALFHIDYKKEVRLTQSCELPVLPPGVEYACQHVLKKLVKLDDRSVRHPKRMQFTIRTAGRVKNAMLCRKCKEKSDAFKKTYGSDKDLFIGVRKATPEELKHPPMPDAIRKAIAGK